MKKSIAGLITAVFLLYFTAITFSQNNTGAFKPSFIQSYPLWVTFNKTTNLIFPYEIKSVDRGSRDVLAQKAKGLENILLVKAGKVNFPQTNLSVVTADGKFYSFLLNYSGDPAQLNIAFSKETADENNAVFQSGKNEAKMSSTAEMIARKKRMLHGIKDKKYGLRLRLNGLYIRSDVLYFQLEVKNESTIGYDIDMLRFFVRDDKKAQRTAYQELEVQPLYIYGDTSAVKAQSKSVFVIALPKFTIPDQKYLLLQLMERNGGRHLFLRMPNRTLVKATLLND